MRTLAAIGRFRVDALIGTGAFSAVYRAHDPRIGSDVAIKLLADHHSLDPDIRERFIAEARLLRRLNSPHVVRLYELDETERHQPFHVLELIGGGSLDRHRQRMLAAGRTVTESDLATVAHDLTAALTALHAERIVHRDLSPKNLLVRPAGGGGEPGASGVDPGVLAPSERLVLADLGISKDLGVSSGLTAAAGTAGFAAPEQQVIGSIDERVDVYAASAVLVWLVTGVRPDEASAAAIVASGFPPALATVLIDGLAADPAARPATIQQWHDAVRDALGLVVAIPPRVIATVTAAAPTSRPRWTAVAVAVAGLAAVAAGYGIGAAGDAADDDAVAPSATTVEGSVLRAEQTVGDVTAAFTGPVTLVVGERGTYAADVTGTEVWTWVSEDGAQVAAESGVNIAPSAPGTFTLRLIAVGRDGTAATATADIEVVVATVTAPVTTPTTDP